MDVNQTGMEQKMTVGELRRMLQGISADIPVEMELYDDDGVQVAVGDLQVASVEERCDEIPRLYLWGENGKVREPAGEARGELSLVP